MCIFALVGDRYAKNAGAVFSLKYHMVWCPKYRREVLVPPVDKRLKELLREKAERLHLTIHSMEVMPDQVHLFVESDPRKCVAEMVNGLKGFSSHALRQEFPALKSRLPTLWSRRYFAGSVGSVTEAAIRKYMAEQKGK
jgi:putative transposase